MNVTEYNRSFLLCQDILVNGTYFLKKGLSLKCIIWAMETEVNRRLNTVTTTTQRVYRIFVKFLLFQKSKSNSKTCKSFNFYWVV